MTRCSKELLQLYLDRQIVSAEIILLEEHLSTCRDCRRELNELKILDWDLTHLPEIDVPQELLYRRKMVLDSCFAQIGGGQVEATGEKYSYHLPYTGWKNSLNAFRFFPGSHILKNSVQRWGKEIAVSLAGRTPFLGRLVN